MKYGEQQNASSHLHLQSQLVCVQSEPHLQIIKTQTVLEHLLHLASHWQWKKNNSVFVPVYLLGLTSVVYSL